jgi:6-phosphogluconolactonase (cycloisomerase 2 family)
VQQNAAHPHDMPFDPSGQFVAVPDKGLDRVFIFRVDATHGRFVPASPPWLRSQPGAGPRHIAFHPTRGLAYVINELNSTITAYAFQSNGDGLQELQTLTSLPPTGSVKNTGAEIAVHPNGRWVYVSNRGHNSIGTFSIDDGDGKLQPVSWEPTQGDTPRAFAIDLSGRFLYVANQASHTIVAFHIDDRTGKLSATGHVISTGSPSSIVFTAIRQGSRD